MPGLPKKIPIVGTSLWTMYRAIVGIGVLCALLIVGVFQGTAARIKANEEAALRRAVDQVLPAAVTLTQVTMDDAGDLTTISNLSLPFPVFLGYDDSGNLIGAAVTAAGMGYQDTIRCLYAYSFEDQAIVGLKVLESKETPGLGDKIETDEDFLENFVALDATLSPDGKSLANAIETVPNGEKVSPWQIDAITGASVSSVAIGNILNQSAARWVPILVRDAASITPDKGETDDGV